MVKWPGIVLVYFFILEPQIVIIMLSGAPFPPGSLSSSSLTLLCWRHHVPPSKKRENWLKTGWLSMVTESDKKKRRPSCWYDAMTFATMFCHNGVVSFSGCHSVDNFIAVVLIVGLTSFAFFFLYVYFGCSVKLRKIKRVPDGETGTRQWREKKTLGDT